MWWKEESLNKKHTQKTNARKVTKLTIEKEGFVLEKGKEKNFRILFDGLSCSRIKYPIFVTQGTIGSKENGACI